ncbi:COX15/CtaA family protein [Terrimonas pollutisoli]|uniref:COX15/CtaA family protein n=1 Tax=Terrimonas pollutisoli TaxID=3034147 RepID=UPI0023EE1F50|nr:COX15/CtaA family protein [Terrimonas sp. H1YJ31]
MHNELTQPRSSRPVAIWLLTGVFMIIIQVLLGGITRLTGSGLSITEWKPIMGALPPMNEQDWMAAFEKYQQIAQYKYLNYHFTLADFKFIFFWEWFHRLWARLIGVVFIIPFIIFIIQKRFKREMIRPLIILFLLGGLQGLVGWIMVQSGLDDSELLYVSHYKLAIHFIFALVLLCYTLWFALKLLVPASQLAYNNKLRSFTGWLIALLTLQLIYGAFMAGLKAATAAPTWPSINGVWWPVNIHSFGDREFAGISFLVDHPLVIHFIHRNLAYIITILLFIWSWQAFKIKTAYLFSRTRGLPLLLVLVQVILGILSVLYSPEQYSFLWLAVAHQFVAMLLLLALVWMFFIIRNEKNRLT